MRKVLAILVALLLGNNIDAQLSVTNLQCENRIDPLGVDVLNPAFSWELQSGLRGIMQSAFRVLVADDKTQLEKNTGNVWDSEKRAGDASINVKYAGPTLKAGKVYYWKVMVWDNQQHQSGWSNMAYWQMGLLKMADWKGASWIAYEALPDSNKIIPAAHGKGKKEWGTGKDILPLIRKSFSVDKAIKRSTVFICGLGHFDMMVNEKKAGDHFLDPGWTKYDKEAEYVTFDITSLLKKGSNSITVMLGNGFYYQPRERYRKLSGAFGYPKMICRIFTEYEDGSFKNIVSDNSWIAAPGPITFSSIYGGEDYNANLDHPAWGWDPHSLDDMVGRPAVTVKGPPVLYSQMAEPVKFFGKFSPVSAKMLKPSQWIFDLGQNFSGIPAITVSGKKGDTVRIRAAELVNDDGTANQKATGSPSYFTYILKGNGTESWQPQFTYTGFRYLQVEGAVPDTAANPLQLPQLKLIEGLHIRNAAASIGSFSCSNELFNRTNKLIDWAIKSNMVSVFTDCPHREKLGWLEETHLMGGSVRYGYDIAALGKKVVRDMMQSQTADGLIPEIAPEFVQFEEPFRDSPEWGSAAVLFPWYLFQWYGDRQLLEDAYPMMKKYLTYLQSKAKDNILTQGLGDWYDLGPKPPGVSQLTPQGLTATAFYYHDLDIVSQVASLLNKKDEAKLFIKQAEAVRQSFNDRFYNSATAQYGSGSQTANAIAVYMKLVDEKNKIAVVDNIVKELSDNNYRLTAGDIGYRYLLRVLDDEGRQDVIFKMNNRDDVPGYGYQLKNGATALTESWQAMPSVSNNHFMLGHLQEWFYSGIAGIRPGVGSVAFKTIEIRPQPVGDLTWAKAEFRSPYGLISSSWKIKDNKFYLDVHIPVNAKAVVHFGNCLISAISESGKPIAGRPGIKMPVTPGKEPAVEIGSGDYSFTINGFVK